jgi:hypothetical protein
MAMLHAVGAPGFTLKPLTSVEDDVHWMLSHERPKKWTSAMLRSSFCFLDTESLAELMKGLQPLCKLPGVALDEIFPPRVAFQAIHYSVLYASPPLVQKLLRAADNVGIRECIVNARTEEGKRCSISPLFMAVLFADKDVVDVLRSNDACLNDIDAEIAMRLHAASLRADLKNRLITLQLDVEAEELERTVEQMHQQDAQEEPDLRNPAADTIANGTPR